jgi:hypothetical protein
MFPRITNGKVYLPFGGTTPDGIDVDGMYELSPEDPSYEVTKAWLIQVERGEWSLPHAGLLWYEAWGGSWEEILDCLAAERERRLGQNPELNY